MAKQSILTEAKNTVVEVGKTAAEGAKNVATDALAAGAAAAVGVVAKRISQGLRAGENKVQGALPSARQAALVAERAVKGTPRRKAAAKARRAGAKKVTVKSRNVRAAAKKKRGARPSKRTAAARAPTRSKSKRRSR
jgi:hypothetical protein